MKKTKLLSKYNNSNKVNEVLAFVQRTGAKKVRDNYKLKIKLLRGGWIDRNTNNYTVVDYILQNNIKIIN